MSFETARSVIQARMSSGYSTTPVAYDNHEFVKPTDGSSWVRFTILEGDSDLAGIGASTRLFRNTGVIVCQVFIQAGKGSKPALDIIDVLTTLWSGASFNGITCRAASVARVGTDEGWYQVNLSIPYYWDNIM